ncbi:TetR-like C-terminal domain-containing protein [Nocardia sp. NPDC003963]
MPTGTRGDGPHQPIRRPRRWFPTHKSLLGAVAEVGSRDPAGALTAAAGTDIAGWARAYIEFAWARPAMFTLIFRHDLLDGSGAGLRSVSTPLFDRLVGRVRTTAADPDPLTTATALSAGVHGIAVLSTTGALTLAAPGADIDDLIRRVLRTTLE